MKTRQETLIPFPACLPACAHYLRAIDPHCGRRRWWCRSAQPAMKALLCIGAAVPAGISASKANTRTGTGTGTGFGLLGRCRSLSFPRSTAPFIRAPLCGCSRDPPAPLPEDSDNRQDESERDVDIAQDVTHSWMEPWEMLLDHIFGPPGPDKLMVQLLEPIDKQVCLFFFLFRNLFSPPFFQISEN